MRCTSSSASETALLMLGKGSRRFSRTRAPPALPGPVPPTPRAAGRRLHCTPYDVRARWHATRAHKTTRTTAGAAWTRTGQATRWPLPARTGQAPRPAAARRQPPHNSTPKTSRARVTPDKAPTLRGVAPAVGYAWATPHKKQQPRTRAISHPALASRSRRRRRCRRPCEMRRRGATLDRRRVPGEARRVAAARLVRSAVRRPELASRSASAAVRRRAAPVDAAPRFSGRDVSLVPGVRQAAAPRRAVAINGAHRG